MGRTNKLKVGDLVVERKTKKSFIVLEVAKYRRVGYGTPNPPGASKRKKFLVVSPTGRQRWKVDTALKVEFFLPDDPYSDDIR